MNVIEAARVRIPARKFLPGVLALCAGVMAATAVADDSPNSGGALQVADATATTAAPAAIPPAPAPDKNGSQQLETIVVTAQKRKQNLTVKRPILTLHRQFVSFQIEENQPVEGVAFLILK